jgi:glycine oxidase
LAEFELDAFFQKAGSLVVAHPQDQAELVRFAHTISLRSTESNFSPVAREEIAALEPDLDAVFSTGLYFPREGQIDSRDVLKAMHQALIRGKVTLYFNQAVEVAPYIVRTAQDVQKFDIVFDCRGYGAANDLPNLRPVRGEIIRVYAPDVKLNRPIRLLHPRWPIYVVPRPNGHYIIGATAIESDDTSPISTRSLLELLSAALALNSGFSEARILETNVGLRPAFPDNMPRLLHQPGLIRANGLYRHGFLLAPVITEAACKLAETGKPHITHIGLIREAA